MRLDSIVVVDRGNEISFSFEEMVRYNGGRSPGGVALAFKVLERALPLLEPDGRIERREIFIETAFGGPGARDAFELVTRAVSEERITIDRSLMEPGLETGRERFVFRLRYRDREVTVRLRAGFVSDEFLELAGRETRTPEEEGHLAVLKAEMAACVMSAAAGDVYELSGDG